MSHYPMGTWASRDIHLYSVHAATEHSLTCNIDRAWKDEVQVWLEIYMKSFHAWR